LAPEAASNNPLAEDLFNLLKERITPKRKASRTGRAPTRMKY
jgi:ribosomal protein L17